VAVAPLEIRCDCCGLYDFASKMGVVHVERVARVLVGRHRPPRPATGEWMPLEGLFKLRRVGARLLVCVLCRPDLDAGRTVEEVDRVRSIRQMVAAAVVILLLFGSAPWVEDCLQILRRGIV
jgi:hypothetical protein